MELGKLAKLMFDVAYQALDGFEIAFADVTINGWTILIGGAIAIIVANLIGRIFE